MTHHTKPSRLRERRRASATTHNASPAECQPAAVASVADIRRGFGTLAVWYLRPINRPEGDTVFLLPYHGQV